MSGKLCDADEQNLYSHMQMECNKFIQEKLQSRMKVPPQYHIRHEDNGFILHEYTGLNVYQLCAQFRVSAELSEVAQLLASPSTNEYRNWMGFWHGKGFIDGAVLHESETPPLDPAGQLEKLCVKCAAVKHGRRGVRDMIFADYSVLEPTISSEDPTFAQFQLSLEKMPNPSLMDLEYHYNTQKFNAERIIVEPSGFLVQPVKNNPAQLQVMCYMSWNRQDGVTSGFKNHLQHVMQGLNQLYSAIISLRLDCLNFVKPKDWVDDRFRQNCGVCDQSFTALKRKHHCRVCGDVICSRCSLIVSTALPTIGMTKVRSCKICISKPMGCDDICSDRGSWIEDAVVKQMTGRDSSETLKPLPAHLVPENELGRLEALDSYEILQEDDSNATFEIITDLACHAFVSAMAGVAFVDDRYVHLRGSVGLEKKMYMRHSSLDAHAIMADEVLEISDASRDERYRQCDAVRKEPSIRFYAAAPIITKDGHALGTVFVADTEPREPLTPEKLKFLRKLAVLALHAMEDRNEDYKIHAVESQEFMVEPSSFAISRLSDILSRNSQTRSRHVYSPAASVKTEEGLSKYIPK